MSLKTIKYLETATDDLERIYNYIYRKSYSPNVALKYINRIRKRVLILASFPLVGVNRDDLGEGLRSLSFEKRAIIIYRFENDLIEIIKIFYGGQDYENNEIWN